MRQEFRVGPVKVAVHGGWIDEEPNETRKRSYLASVKIGEETTRTDHYHVHAEGRQFVRSEIDRRPIFTHETRSYDVTVRPRTMHYDGGGRWRFTSEEWYRFHDDDRVHRVTVRPLPFGLLRCTWMVAADGRRLRAEGTLLAFPLWRLARRRVRDAILADHADALSDVKPNWNWTLTHLHGCILDSAPVSQGRIASDHILSPLPRHPGSAEAAIAGEIDGRPAFWVDNRGHEWLERTTRPLGGWGQLSLFLLAFALLEAWWRHQGDRIDLKTVAGIAACSLVAWLLRNRVREREQQRDHHVSWMLDQARRDLRAPARRSAAVELAIADTA